MKKKIIAVGIIAFAVLGYAAPPMIESGGFLFFPKIVLTAQGTGGTVGMCTDGSACNYGLYSADTTHVALRAGAADYLSVGSSANGNVTGSLVISAGATAASITCTSPGAADAIIATAGAFQNTSGVGAVGQVLKSGGASASTTWGNETSMFSTACWATTCTKADAPAAANLHSGGITSSRALTTVRVTCSWSTAGAVSGGTDAVNVTVRNVTDSSDVCSCALGTPICTTVNTPYSCDCAGAVAIAKKATVYIKSTGTNCATMPGQILCNVEYTVP